MSSRGYPKESSLSKRKKEVEVVEIGPQGNNKSNLKLSVESFFELVQKDIQSYDLKSDNVSQAAHALTIEDCCHNLFETTFQEPLLLVRRHAVLINFNPIYAVVLADKVFLVFAKRTKVVNLLVKEVLRGVVDVWEESKQLSIKRKINNFSEHRFYSAIFTVVLALHEDQVSSLFKRVNTSVVPSSSRNESQNVVKGLKHDLDLVSKSVESYRTLLSCIARDEDQVALMSLSVLKSNPQLYSRPITSEICQYIYDSLDPLETCLAGFDLHHANLSKVETMLKRKIEKENSRLRGQEYNYIARRLSLRTMTIMFTAATVWCSFFTMNLDNGIYFYGSYFYAIFLCLTVLVMVVCLNIVFNYFKKYYFDIKVDRFEKS